MVAVGVGLVEGATVGETLPLAVGVAVTDAGRPDVADGKGVKVGAGACCTVGATGGGVLVEAAAVTLGEEVGVGVVVGFSALLPVEAGVTVPPETVGLGLGVAALAVRVGCSMSPTASPSNAVCQRRCRRWQLVARVVKNCT
jgi:hypothetical protein